MERLILVILPANSGRIAARTLACAARECDAGADLSPRHEYGGLRAVALVGANNIGDKIHAKHPIQFQNFQTHSFLHFAFDLRARLVAVRLRAAAGAAPPKAAAANPHRRSPEAEEG
jgi:hypothetical protein